MKWFRCLNTWKSAETICFLPTIFWDNYWYEIELCWLFWRVEIYFKEWY